MSRSSRTGTTRYLHARARVIGQARADGLTHCPGYERRDGSRRSCGRELDYVTPYLPGSAETDHVVEVAAGGDDTVENLRVLCRACNQERNEDSGPRLVGAEEFPVSREW